ncbi:MAG: hypothetical protein F2667_05510 [Actinobacteria bacterium]|uniref:Unannotated protein n=1 Tax=freshwater metagenome TaxID=449393 RepID=A0A6J6Q163_9ZZZZ|nr:hypothetical protein [Actinomycetota bacterium]
MPLATYKDLSIDAVDPLMLAAFWAPVLGLVVEPQEDDLVRLVGPTPRHDVWLARVPEPVTVKQRVHLDVHAAALADVVDLGASVVDAETHRWAVVRDPEGGELCVFERAEVPAQRLYEVVVDAVDPLWLATWWGEVLGGVVGRHDVEDWAWVEEIPGAPFESLVFVAVPEPKSVKNRVHWDVEVTDVALLTGARATVVRAPDDEIRWTVLADPEGNEFCAFEV